MTPFDDARFLREAERTLTHLFDELEAAEGAFDIDTEEGDNITLTLDAGGTYIISKHAPTKQLWLSSPHSGASHYEYVEQSTNAHPADCWRNTRSTDSNASLKETLFAELRAHANAII